MRAKATIRCQRERGEDRDVRCVWLLILHTVIAAPCCRSNLLKAFVCGGLVKPDADGYAPGERPLRRPRMVNPRDIAWERRRKRRR